jgi:3-hydroxyisobutyrate dehydrogenase-like beta-hydroxyacid dehydrogenase
MSDDGAAAEHLRVGVIGLGAMGGPIARHLLEAGREVYVVDPDVEAVRRCRGAVWVLDPAMLASQVDVVLVVVPTDEDVLAVCTGADGVLARAAAGTVVVLCSSLRPETCRSLQAAAGPGVAVVDAALTGGVRGAESGTVNLLVGGDESDLDRARAALTPWCSSIHHLGALGAGQVAKTANNLIHWAQISAIREALTLAAAYGLDVPAVRAALAKGPTDSRTLRELDQMRLTWHVKDLANAQRMAADVGMSLPIAEAARLAMLDTTVDGLRELLGSSAQPTAVGSLP